jgi:acetyl esterase/lipase
MYVSPYWADDLKGLPPVLIQCGGAERLFDEDMAMAKRLEQEGTSPVTMEVFKVTLDLM